MFKKSQLGIFLCLLASCSTFVIAAEKVSLTADEKTYLQALPALTLCVDPDWFPYEKIEMNGQYVGLVAEYMAMFQDRLNISFNILKTKSWEETQTAYRNGSCDIVSALNKTPEREQYLTFTKPYINSPAVLAINANNKSDKQLADLKGKTLGMVKGYVYDSKLRTQYPDINIQYFMNMEDAIQSVSNGEIDATLGPLFLLFALTQEMNVNNLKIMGDSEFKDELRIGIKKDSTVLASIFSKAVSGLTNKDNAEIRQIWATKRQSR